jgi:hypothetical protein
MGYGSIKVHFQHLHRWVLGEVFRGIYGGYAYFRNLIEKNFISSHERTYLSTK